MTTAVHRPETIVTVSNFIRFLETGNVADGLFAPDLFTDLSLPHWRVQADTEAEVIAIRAKEHPLPGTVKVERIEETGHGFTIEFEERWDYEGGRWYSREMIRADVIDGTIVELSVYCTGDWDETKQREHAQSVKLIRT